jgi:hypothetical protein
VCAYDTSFGVLLILTGSSTFEDVERPAGTKEQTKGTIPATGGVLPRKKASRKHNKKRKIVYVLPFLRLLIHHK